MKWIGNISIIQKLGLVILPPLLASLVYGLILLNDKYQYREDLSRVQSLSLLSVKNSNLVHELQKERGMSAGFIGSKGKAFADKLPAQRTLTNKVRDSFNQFLSTHILPVGFQSEISQVQEQLAILPSVRQQVDDLSISVADEVAYYTKLNAILLSIVDLTAKSGADQSIAIKAVAFSAFLQMKERAGIERAVLSSTFGQNGFKVNTFTRFVTLVAEQNSYQERFLALVADELKRDYQTLLSSDAMNKVTMFRKIALSQDSVQIATQNPVDWFTTSTDWIELLRKFEGQLADDLVAVTLAQLESSTSSMIWLASLFFVMFLLVVILSFSVARYLHQNLYYVASRISDSRRKFDLSVRIDHEGNDEFGELATAFNDMMSDFESVIQSVRASSSLIIDSVNQLNGYTGKMQDDISIGYSEAEQVASAMTEMSATVAQIAANAVEAAQASSSASQEASEGRIEVDKTSESIKSLADEMAHASNSINELDKEIHSIVSVLDVISGIAEQTNLLALNAAIEAARAGDLGRGFAVVADEVRNLAQRAKESTSDIKNMTERLKTGASVAVKSMEVGQVKAEESVIEAERAGNELTRIVSHVCVIDRMNEQIATATHQQSAVADDVNHNALKISDIYQNTKEIADQISLLNTKLLSASNTMSQQVSKFTLS
ncbi:methyl-accepting chemotaxis protein [Psychromonas sp. MME2]|uniref:methyl-accepting chemotaxis protein n=1 Tax=Psychromonas sp. MME2 TaxID=3231033 RepID=UPI00339D27D9